MLPEDGYKHQPKHVALVLYPWTSAICWVSKGWDCRIGLVILDTPDRSSNPGYPCLGDTGAATLQRVDELSSATTINLL